eukprot:6000883-Pyramimonas_sp.AAC.1
MHRRCIVDASAMHRGCGAIPRPHLLGPHRGGLYRAGQRGAVGAGVRLRPPVRAELTDKGNATIFCIV